MQVGGPSGTLLDRRRAPPAARLRGRADGGRLHGVRPDARHAGRRLQLRALLRARELRLLHARAASGTTLVEHMMARLVGRQGLAPRREGSARVAPLDEGDEPLRAGTRRPATRILDALEKFQPAFDRRSAVARRPADLRSRRGARSGARGHRPRRRRRALRGGDAMSDAPPLRPRRPRRPLRAGTDDHAGCAGGGRTTCPTCASTPSSSRTAAARCAR